MKFRPGISVIYLAIFYSCDIIKLMKIAVIIPAHNEAKHISSVLSKIPTTLYGATVETFVVDDGSKDNTHQVARSFPHVRVVRHRTNLGKGAAAKTGCDAACRLGADIIVLMDADGQHRPEDIEKLVKPLLVETKPILVIGAREIGGCMPMTMQIGNKLLTAATNLLFGVQTKDSQSGFRAFRASHYASLRWLSPNYAMEAEMLILAAQHKLTCVDVHIPTIYLDNYKGTTVLDGVRVLQTLLKWKILWFREYNLLESYSVS